MFDTSNERTVFPCPPDQNVRIMLDLERLIRSGALPEAKARSDVTRAKIRESLRLDYETLGMPMTM